MQTADGLTAEFEDFALRPLPVERIGDIVDIRLRHRVLSHEKRLALPLVVSSTLLFLAGGLNAENVGDAIRTEEAQVDLRRTNSYAARSTSAHQYGTTVDVSHERFAVPAGPRAGSGAAAQAPAGAWEMEAEMLEEVAREHAKALQAELGRALAELRAAGAVHVMMENKQPVYHFTLARRFAQAASR